VKWQEKTLMKVIHSYHDVQISGTGSDGGLCRGCSERERMRLAGVC